MKTDRQHMDGGLLPTDWQVMQLADVSTDFISGGTPSTKEPAYWDGEIPWMTSAHIDGRRIDQGMRYITREGLTHSAAQIVPKNSLLVASRVGIGKIAVNLIDMAISQDLTGVVLDKNKIDTGFAFWLLSTYESKLKALAQGSTIKGLVRRDIQRLRICLPPMHEQRRIAAILSTVDEAIGKVDEAIAKTQRLKKGLMQELLTKGIGHKEFKDTEIGRIPKAWEVAGISDLLTDLRNGFASGKRDPHGIAQVRMNNVTTDGRLLLDSYIRVPEPKAIDEWLLKDGDFLFNNTNSIDLVGKTAIFKGAPFACSFSNHFTRLRFKTNVLPEWVLSHFIMLWRKGFFKSVAIRHVGQAAVNKDYILKIELPVPPLPEQKQIAAILSSVDKRLELLVSRREKLNRIKKALMNDLLTGRKRVKVEA